MTIFQFKENAIKDPAVVEALQEIAIILNNLILEASDPDAIHENVPGEINSITEKAVPVDADIVVIEDSEESNSKKRAQLINLPGGGGTVADESTDTTCFPGFYTAATGALPPKTNSGMTFNSATGAFSATSIGGIPVGDLVGKANPETITGAWIFDGASNTVQLANGCDLQLESNDGNTTVTFNHNNSDLRLSVSGTGFNSQPLRIMGFLDLRVDSPMKIKEQAAADADSATYGQIWIKDTTPCQLWFTDDAGTDTQIV